MYQLYNKPEVPPIVMVEYTSPKEFGENYLRHGKHKQKKKKKC